MTVSGISSNPYLYSVSNLLSNSQQQKDPLQLLGQALRSGDLTAAQQAYNALLQTTSNPVQTQNSQFSQGLTAVGQALKTGDLTSAQQTYAKLRQDFQAVEKTHHRHHHHKTNSSQNSTFSSNGGSSANTGTTPSVSIAGVNLLDLLT